MDRKPGPIFTTLAAKLKILKGKPMAIIILVLLTVSVVIFFALMASIKIDRNTKMEVVGKDLFVYQLSFSFEYPIFSGWKVFTTDQGLNYTPANFNIYRPYKISIEEIAVKVDPSYWDDASATPKGIKYKLWDKEDYYEKTIVWGEGKQYLINMPLDFTPDLKDTILNSIDIFNSEKSRAIALAEKELQRHYPDKKHSRDTLYRIDWIYQKENIFWIHYSPRHINDSAYRVMDADKEVTVDIETGRVVDFHEFGA